MAATNITCPGCRTVLTLKQAPPANQSIKCPKCAKVFAVNGAAQVGAPSTARPSQVKAAPPAPAPSAARPSQVKAAAPAPSPSAARPSQVKAAAPAPAPSAARPSQVKAAPVGSSAPAASAPKSTPPEKTHWLRRAGALAMTALAVTARLSYLLACFSGRQCAKLLHLMFHAPSKRTRYLAWGGAMAGVIVSIVAGSLLVSSVSRLFSKKAPDTQLADDSDLPDMPDDPVLKAPPYVLPEIPKPKFSQAKVQVALSEPFASMTTGGGGRYLVFHLKKAKKLAVYDCSELKIIKELEVSSEDVLLAGGLEQLMVVLPAEKVVQRWSLKTLQREKTSVVPDGLDVRRVLMGAASAGPLLLFSTLEGRLFDIEKMAPLQLPGEKLRGADRPMGVNYGVSMDGRSFCNVVFPGSGPSTLSVMRVGDERTVLSTKVFDGSKDIIRDATLNADASLVFSPSRVFGSNLKRQEAKWLEGWWMFGTEDPRLFVAVKGRGGAEAEVSICTTADRRVIHTIKGLEEMPMASFGTSMEPMPNGELRVRYLASAGVLVTVPASNDKIVARPLDLTETLDNSGENYLFVMSAPRTRVALGRSYEYPLEVKSKSGGVQYQLETGPKGMTLSNEGMLRWKAPTQIDCKPERIIITLKDSKGKEAIHSFELSKVIAPTTVGQVVRLPLASDHHLTPGQDLRSLLLLQGEYLSVLSADGGRVERVHRLGQAYQRIAEREDYYVALSANPQALDLIDKKTLKQLKRFDVKSVSPQYLIPQDLAVHPTREVSYVTVKTDIEVPRYRVVVVDEKAGTVTAPDGMYGTFVAADPAGQLLYVGYKDLITRGSRFHMNPGGQIIRIPEYGSIDVLLTYDVRDGVPKFRQSLNKAGGNGSGVRISADGKRVSYLSHVGFPEFSGKVPGFAAHDINLPPVSYQVGGTKGTATSLAYHPILPLVAIPAGNDGVMFFHRETGAAQSDRLNSAGGLSDLNVHHVQFTPAGTHLLADGTDQGGERVLHLLELRLGSDETSEVSKGYKRPSPASLPTIAVAPTEKPAPGEPPREDAQQKVRKQAIAWIKDQNAFGADARIVETVTKMIDESLDRNRGFIMHLGHALVKSGKTTLLAGRYGAFAAFELTPEQAKSTTVGDKGISCTGIAAENEERDPRVVLAGLKLPAKLPVNEKIAGTVQYKDPEREKAHYAMRLYLSAGGTSSTLYYHGLGEHLIPAEGTINFSFSDLKSLGVNQTQPAVLFIDLCSFDSSTRRGDVTVVSNTIAVLVDLLPK